MPKEKTYDESDSGSIDDHGEGLPEKENHEFPALGFGDINSSDKDSSVFLTCHP